MGLDTDSRSNRMLSSLRVRLLATMMIILLVALGTMAILASQATTAEFERSVGGILRYSDPRIYSKTINIQKFITQHQGEQDLWPGLQQLLEGMQITSNTRYVIADLDGKVYVDSTGRLVGQRLNLANSKPFAAFLIEGEPMLSYFEPLDAPDLQLIQQGFTDSVNNSLLIAILVAGVLALLLALLLSHSILSPVSALTRAARRMESGDLDQRVQVRSNGELGALAQAFNAMADGLQRQEQLRRNMVSDVAHELRTPLSNVRGYLEALQDGVVEPTPELIGSLHEEALSLNRLVDELQELALAEAGQLHLEIQPVKVLMAVEKALLAVRAQARTRQVSLQMDISPDLPLILADGDRLHQILCNLLDNALTHTPAGGQICVHAAQVVEAVEFRIQDTGEGIATEHLPLIFERFYRVDKSRDRTTGGAGLGLAIVRQLVEAQGGRVSAHSSVGEGTTIQFSLPVAPPGPEPATIAMPGEQAPSSIPIQPASHSTGHL
jgi:signal transduction histidine kinase